VPTPAQAATAAATAPPLVPALRPFPPSVVARAAPAPAAAAIDATPVTAAPDEDALPTLAILSPGERAALPALKLSMHVWNETPARRFAIVDGQRIVEGAQLGGAVVTQIRRDGVELDVNGRRVLLPRP
jgi:general secretion pathway protein B